MFGNGDGYGLASVVNLAEPPTLIPPRRRTAQNDANVVTHPPLITERLRGNDSMAEKIDGYDECRFKILQGSKFASCCCIHNAFVMMLNTHISARIDHSAPNEA